MIKFKLTDPRAQMPKRAHNMSAGFDLHALVGGVIPPGRSAIIPTGVAVELPYNAVGLIRGRSGLAFKHNIESFEGTIDADYRGDIGIKLHNFSDQPFEYSAGDRVCQMVVVQYLGAAILVDELDDTVRGSSGFGSTGGAG